MKNEAQPQHTQGEWVILAGGNENVSINTKGKNGKAICITLTKTDEDLANAQRIVKAVNIHDELVDGLKRAINDFSKSTWTEETYKFLEQLLKQAEGK